MADSHPDPDCPYCHGTGFIRPDLSSAEQVPCEECDDSSFLRLMNDPEVDPGLLQVLTRILEETREARRRSWAAKRAASH